MRQSKIVLVFFGWFPGFKRFQAWNQGFIKRHPKYCVFSLVAGTLEYIALVAWVKKAMDEQRELNQLAADVAELEQKLAVL